MILLILSLIFCVGGLLKALFDSKLTIREKARTIITFVPIFAINGIIGAIFSLYLVSYISIFLICLCIYLLIFLSRREK